jgi:hypothetical protein
MSLTDLLHSFPTCNCCIIVEWRQFQACDHYPWGNVSDVCTSTTNAYVISRTVMKVRQVSSSRVNFTNKNFIRYYDVRQRFSTFSFAPLSAWFISMIPPTFHRHCYSCKNYFISTLFMSILDSLTHSLLPEKLPGPQLVRKFLSFYGTRSFITAFTKAHHLSLSWAGSIQSMPPILLLEDSF